MRTQEEIRKYLAEFKAKKLQEREKAKLKKAKKPKKEPLTEEEKKAKMKAYQKAYREAHKDKMHQQQRAWYEANREKVLEQQKEYRQANREYLNALQRNKYRKNNLLIYSERDIEKFYARDLYQTREELMEAEETENARIDWTKFDQLINETKKQNGLI